MVVGSVRPCLRCWPGPVRMSGMKAGTEMASGPGRRPLPRELVAVPCECSATCVPAALHRVGRSRARMCAGTFFEFPAHSAQLTHCRLSGALHLRVQTVRMAAPVRFNSARPKPRAGLRSSDASDGPGGHLIPSLLVGKDLSTAVTFGRVAGRADEWADSPVLGSLKENEDGQVYDQ